MSADTLGHYELLEKLGEGGMGVVYRALDRKLRREVAIKLLPESTSDDPERLARFKREALLLASLNHPSIVGIHSIEEIEGLPFLVMELVQGQPLSKLIPSEGLDLRVILDYAIQIADAVGAAHEHGVLHRDLKPGNVMITPEGRVKILDFGLGRFLLSARVRPGETTTLHEVETGTGHLLGTPPYMSPEQLEGGRTDARSDVFSLGVVMYEMATGHRPFSGKSSAALLAAILKDEPAPISEARSDLPRHLSRIIRQCLAKKPDRRFQMAQDLRNSLLELQNEVISGETLAVAGGRPRSRSWARVLAVSTLFLFVVVLGATLLWFSLGEGPRYGEASVAVLPLKNLSGNSEQDYIGDGVTEDIISMLGRFPEVSVISSTSVMRYKESLLPVSEIGRDLGVTYLVEGSLRSDGRNVRIVSRLVDIGKDKAVSLGTFDRTMEDLFELQSEVSEKIVVALRGQLSEDEGAVFERPRPDPDAYEVYLRGRYFLMQRTEEAMRKAVELFDEAIELDPRYAAAWAAKAEAHSLLGTFGIEPTLESHRLSFEAAEKALELDPSSPEAHFALGVAAFGNWDWEAAESSLERALELSSHHAEAHRYLAYCLVTQSEFERAIRHAQVAKRLDPASPITQLSVGAVFFLADDYPRAIEAIEAAIEMVPESARAHAALAGVLAYQGSMERASAELDEALRLGDGSPEIASTEVFVWALRGETERAEKRLEELTPSGRSWGISPGDAASAYALIGNHTKALELLEIGFRERDPVLAYLAVDPGFDGMREDPGFAAWIEKVGLAGGSPLDQERSSR